MKAIEIMNEEHKYILRMLIVVRKICLSILDGKEIKIILYKKKISNIL